MIRTSFKILKVLLSVILILVVAIFLFMQQDSFGRLPSGSRAGRIAQSPNYKNGKFQNLVETPALAPNTSYVTLFAKFFASSPDKEPLRPLPTLKTDLKSIPAEKPTIIWFGHSSYLISINGRKILADPVFSERASPVQYTGPKNYPGTALYKPEDFPDLDVIVISHDHYDHLDYNTILTLREKTKIFCVGLGVGEHLEQWGVKPEQIREFDWWEAEEVLEGVHLTSTPARHFSGRGFSRNKTLWSSFVLETGGLKIFIGGDSGFDDAFKDIGEKFGPFDIAMLECGQYDVQWPFIHMMPEETVQAALDLRAKVFLPVHWGKFTLANHPWRDPIQRAVKHALANNANVTTPKIGEPIILGESLPFEEWWNGSDYDISSAKK
jgi:L-ascorbate metabolism protein UlaG (beta-lactamase superfamily)